MDQKVTPGEIVVMAAGGVALIASFLPFFSIDEAGVDESYSSLSTGFPTLFPVATLIPVAIIAAAVLLVLTKFANMTIGDVLGIGLVQLIIALSFFGALLALAYLIQDTPEGLDKGFGYWLLLLSGLASIVGAILVSNERGRPGTAGPPPAAPPPPPTA